MPVDRSAKEPPSRRPSRLRKVLLRTAIGLVALVAALYLGRRLWLPPFVRHVGPIACERLLGFEFEIEAVASADFDHLELVGVELRAIDPAFPVRSARAAELSADFSISGLAADWMTGLHAVRGRGLELEIDVRAPAAEVDVETTEPTLLPARLPRIDLEDVDLALDVPEARLELDLRRLACTDGERLELATGSARWSAGEDVLDFRELALSLRYRDARVDELALSTDGEPRVGDAAVDLSRLVQQSELDARGRILTPGGGADFELELRPAWLDARAQAESLRLDRFRPFVPSALHDLAGELALDLDARLALDDPGASTARVRLAANEVSLTGQRAARVQVTAELGDRTLRIASLEALDGPNELRARGLELSIDDLSVKEWLGRLRGEVEVLLGDPERVHVELDPELRRFARDARISLAASIADGVATFQRLDVTAPGLDARLARGSVRLEPLDSPTLDLELDLAVDDLNAALAPLELEGYAGSMTGYLRAHGRFPHFEGRAIFEGQALRIAGADVGELAFDAEADAHTLRVLRLVARSRSLEVDASGQYDFESDELSDCALRARLHELVQVLPGIARSGSLDLDLSASGRLAAPAVEFELEGSGIELGDFPRIDFGAVARLAQRELQVEALRVESEGESLFASGHALFGERFEPVGARLEAFEHRQERRVAFTLREPVDVEFDDGGLRFSDFELSGEHGRVHLDVEHGAVASHVELSATGLRPTALIERFLPAGLGVGTLDLALELDRVDEKLALSADARAAELRVPGVLCPCELDASIRASPAEGIVADVVADFGPPGNITLHARSGFDQAQPGWLADGELELDAEATLAKLEELIDWQRTPVQASGALNARVELRGPPERLAGSLRVGANELAVVARADGSSVGPVRLEVFARCADAIELESFTLATGAAGRELSLEASGEISAPLDLHAMLADFHAWSCTAEVRLHARSATDDIAGAVELLELALDVEGTLDEPQPRGTITLREGVMRLGSEMPSADRIALALELTPDEARLVSLSGELGGAAFSGRGRADLTGTEPVLDLEFFGAELLLVRTRDLRLRANAHLIAYGPASAPTIAGLVTLVDARYSKNFELDLTGRSGPTSGARGSQVFRFRDALLANARFQVDVRGAEAVKIENSTLATSLWPDLTLQGTGELPVLSGSIFLDPSYVRLPGGTLRIDAGTIRFTEANPFVPTLSLTGSTRMRGYDIQVVIAGPADNPEVALSSNPPLPHETLLVLMTTGQLAEEGTHSSVGETAATLATYLAEDVFAREFGAGPGAGDSLLGRFELLSGQDISQSGAETILIRFRMSDADPKGRRHWHLVGERDVWDYYNYGLRVTFGFR